MDLDWKTIPCGSFEAVERLSGGALLGRRRARGGYKFYAITKGKVSEGEALVLNPSTPTIENKYYKVELNSQNWCSRAPARQINRKDLVNSGSGYRLNEYVYVSGGDPAVQFHQQQILAADITFLAQARGQPRQLDGVTAGAPVSLGNSDYHSLEGLNTGDCQHDHASRHAEKGQHPQRGWKQRSKERGSTSRFPFTLKHPR